MTEEIKEILDKLKYIVDFSIIEHDTSFNSDNVEESVCLLISNECQLLLNYITNLQEENKRIFSKVNDDELLISNAMNYAEAQDYKKRIDKIIAHLGNCDWNNKDFEKLYDIATGSDE